MNLRQGVVALSATAITALSIAPVADAHRSGCHRQYSCPSDHATYKWQGMYCVKPTSDKRDSSFRKKVRYDGKTYYCKRG
jgi:hypothetical protein